MIELNSETKKARFFKAISTKPIGFYLAILLALNLVTNTFLIFSVNSLSEEVYGVACEVGYLNHDLSIDLGKIESELENIQRSINTHS